MRPNDTTQNDELPELYALLSKVSGQDPGARARFVGADGETVSIGQETAMMLVDAIAAMGDAGFRRAGRGLTPRQAGEILAMSRPTVMRYIARGDLQASKVNTHFRISREALEAFAARRAERRAALDEVAAISERYDF